MSTSGFSRRSFLQKAALTVAGISLAACQPAATTEPAKAAEPTTAKAAEPTIAKVEPTAQPAAAEKAKIVVMTNEGQESNGVEAAAPAFANAFPNIELEVQKSPDWRTKVAADFAAGGGSYDVVISPFLFLHDWVAGGHILDLDPYIAADTKYNISDFVPVLYKNYGSWDGKQWSLPYKVDAQMFYYRKDLFENPDVQAAFKSKTGGDLKVPETVEEQIEIAKFFTKSLNPESPVEYGFTNWSERWGSIWWWGNRMADLTGQGWLTPDYHPTMNNEAGLRALKDYVTMMDFAPPDVSTYDWPKSNTSFLTGKAAMIDNWPGLATMAETPEGFWGKSEVIGKTGITLPSGYKVDGKVVHGSVLGGWTSAVSKYTKFAAAAFNTIAWLTGPEGELLKVDTGNPPCRTSTYANWKVTPETKYFPTMFQCMEVARITADVDAPPISQQIQDFMATEIHKTITKQTEPEVALQNIEEEWVKQLKDAGLYE